MQRTALDEPPWVRAVDAAVEGIVLAVALFTLLHLVAAPLGWAVAPVTWGWLVVSVAAGAVLVVRAARRPGDATPPTAEPAGERTPWPVLGAIAVVAVLAAVLEPSAFAPMWVAALGTAGAVWWWAAHAPRPATPAAPAPATRWQHGTALLMSTALAVLMLFVRNPSADDVYYVNRSAWVAEHGTFPLLDTMFSPQKLPLTYGTGLPVTSVEEMYGALAHVTGAAAGTVVYLVALPLLVLVSGWVTWRLVEEWAVRSRLLVLGVALLLPLFVATGLVGDFGPARMWQGKVVALGVVVPLAWWHLTRLARGPGGVEQRHSLSVLGLLGLTWCGLTVTAPLFAPPLALAAVVTAAVVRHARRPLLLGAGALAAAPVTVGLVTALLNRDGPVAEESFIRDAGAAWVRVMGTDRIVTGLLVLGVLAGPLLVRRGASRVLAATASVGLVLAAAPGTIAVFDAVTAAGPVAPRLLLVAPVHVLVALLVTARLPLRGRRPASAALLRRQDAAVATVLVATLAGSGTAVWDPVVDGSLSDRPSWKVEERELADVRALLADEPGPGPVLLPERHMRALAVTSAGTFAAVPRTFYVSLLQDEYQRLAARQILRRFVDEDRPDPPIGRLRAALHTLGITVACASAEDRHVTALSRTGYLNRRTVGSLVCFDRPPWLTVPAPSWPGGRLCEIGERVPGPGFAGGSCTFSPVPWEGLHLTRPRQNGERPGP